MFFRSRLYYITDRKALAPDELTRCRRLLEKITAAAHAGVDYVQLREKDLSTRDLESLARQASRIIAEATPPSNRHPRTTLLINSRIDVALAVGANGVHLRSDDLKPEDARTIWHDPDILRRSIRSVEDEDTAPHPAEPLIAVSCHSVAEVVEAACQKASFAVFAPVFEKKDVGYVQPAGLHQLTYACRAEIPVLALGGITLANARSCLEAGAAGVAGIRLFQENDMAEIVRTLRGM